MVQRYINKMKRTKFLCGNLARFNILLVIEGVFDELLVICAYDLLVVGDIWLSAWQSQSHELL